MNRKLYAILVIISVLAVIFVFVKENGKQKTGNVNLPSSVVGRPFSIVSLSPNLTEIVFALGLGDKVVGVSSECDWPPEARNKPRMGSFWHPNTEEVIAARPALVVCESFLQHKELAQTLIRSQINVLSLRVESIDELYPAITAIGREAGCMDKAGQLVAEIEDKLGRIRDKTSSAGKVRVLWAIQTDPVRVAGVKTFVNEIITIAGGRNVIAPTGDQYPAVGVETLLTCGAEVIIQSAMGDRDIVRQQQAAREFWNKFPSLPAVKNNRVYLVPADTVLRLGPRLPDGALMVAGLLHPQLFSRDVNTGGKDADANE